MASDKIPQTTDASFQTDVLDAPMPVLVDFWAVWCGPCRAITPHLEALADELGDRVKIVKMDVDSNQQTPTTYKVRSIPTLLLFKNGEVVDQLVGNPGSKTRLAKFITAHA